MFTSLMSFVVMTEKWVDGCIRDYAEDYLLHINHLPTRCVNQLKLCITTWYHT